LQKHNYHNSNHKPTSTDKQSDPKPTVADADLITGSFEDSLLTDTILVYKKVFPPVGHLCLSATQSPHSTAIYFVTMNAATGTTSSKHEE
jgi:hypothetical protein